MKLPRTDKGQFQSVSDDYWKRKVYDRYGNSAEFVSVVGHSENGESVIRIKCPYCEELVDVSSITLRKKNRVELVCLKRKSDRAKAEKARAKELRRISKLYQPSFIRFCKCGNVILENCRVCEFCKKETRRKNDRRKEVTRRIRIESDNDKTITLNELFERDNGICYICKKECDWSDFQKVNGAFVVGGSYPTIEHVVPLCAGGSHTWGNVKLACHSCNTKKGRKVF